jgi:NAD(P)-dependent dehydrogenase (short-subunit alcohol dehydrogenase family)
MQIRSFFDLTGKVAIVTGASKGIGAQMARGLAEFGAKVVISSRKQEALDEVASTFQADGLEAVGIACHVGDAEQRQALIDQTMEKYGRIDVLINNAATNPYFGPIDKMTPEVYQKTMAINLDAAMYMSNLVYAVMKKQNSGSIIHISSIEGLHASAGFAAYNLSKAALVMLAKNQAAEWGSDGVRVNVICPGLVKTKLSQMLWKNEAVLKQVEKKIPLQRMAQPPEMAGLAVFLASDASSYMTGSTLVNDGGLLNAGLF